MRKFLLLVSVAAMTLVGCKEKGAVTPAQNDNPVTKSLEAGDFAYVQMDSLINGFNMYIDLVAEYQAEEARVDKDLTARGRKLEKDLMDAQEKVQKGLVTRSQAAQLEEDLGKKQQAFVTSRDQALNDLAEKQQVMLNNIQYAILEYIKEYNADYRFKMIFSTSGSSPVLHADPALDITGEILAGLNKKYAAEKASK